jgi:isopenicillin N synthase-like dioxygenase
MFHLNKAWSNDRIQACVHRVTLSTENETRHSLGLFAFNEGMISVPEELVDEEHPLQYRPLNILEYVKAQKIQVGHGGRLSVKAYCGV